MIAPIPAPDPFQLFFQQIFQTVRLFLERCLADDGLIGGDLFKQVRPVRFRLFPETLPGGRKPVQGADDQVCGKERHEEHEPGGMKDVEQLQGTQDIGDPGTEAADERSRRFLLRNEGAQDGGRRNENQKNNGQFH